MEINNLFDLIILTVWNIFFVFGIGTIGGIFSFMKGFRRGVRISKEQLLKNTPILTPLQNVVQGLLLFIVSIWILFIKGDFFNYIDAILVYFS